MVLEKQGFEVKFYGKIQYLKKYEKVVRCNISAFDFGYVNINAIAFNEDMALFEGLNDEDWVIGEGKMTVNEYKGNKYLQIVVNKLKKTEEPKKDKKEEDKSQGTQVF